MKRLLSVSLLLALACAAHAGLTVSANLQSSFTGSFDTLGSSDLAFTWTKYSEPSSVYLDGAATGSNVSSLDATGSAFSFARTSSFTATSPGGTGGLQSGYQNVTYSIANTASVDHLVRLNLGYNVALGYSIAGSDAALTPSADASTQFQLATTEPGSGSTYFEDSLSHLYSDGHDQFIQSKTASVDYLVKANSSLDIHISEFANATASATPAVPEPASLATLSVGALALLRRRCKKA